MSKKFDNLFSALMLAASAAVILSGMWCLPHSIDRTKAQPSPIPIAPAHLDMPDSEAGHSPEPGKPTYHPAIPLSPELQEALFEACEKSGVPVPLVLGLIEVESAFQVDAVSSEGCYGLCQINPLYAWKLEASTGHSFQDPAGNLYCGVWYLGSLIEQYNGDEQAALRAYNRGFDDGDRTYSSRVLEAAERWGARL